MPIPAKASKPVDTLESRTAIVYGDPGIGKSTLLSDIPDSIFLATEKGLDQITALKWEYPDGTYVLRCWQDVYAATKEAVESGRFKTLIIDNVGALCWLCQEYVCKKHGEEWKSDGALGYGKGQGLIINELKRYFFALSQKRIGCWMTAHSTLETVEGRTGTYDRHIPQIPGDNKKKELLTGIIGMVDMCLYATTAVIDEGGKKVEHRVIRTQPATDYVAKVRGEKGAPPMLDPVPLSWSKLKQAWTLTQAGGNRVALPPVQADPEPEKKPAAEKAAAEPG